MNVATASGKNYRRVRLAIGDVYDVTRPSLIPSFPCFGLPKPEPDVVTTHSLNLTNPSYPAL
jgi:hypothetical protein